MQPEDVAERVHEVALAGAVRADTPYLSVLIRPLPAPVVLPKAARNHLSGTVHSILPRDPSLSFPLLFGSRLSCWVPSLVSRVPRHPRRCHPLLSGAQAGNFPTSLPTTVGAAMAASSADKAPTDELHEEEVPDVFDEGGVSDRS